MTRRLSIVAVICAAVALANPALAWQTTQATAAQQDSSYIDADGTAHITRVVPLPATVSPEARKGLAHQVSDANPHQSLAQRREQTDAAAAAGAKANRAVYPVNITSSKVAGIPVSVVNSGRWRPGG